MIPQDPIYMKLLPTVTIFAISIITIPQLFDISPQIALNNIIELNALMF